MIQFIDWVIAASYILLLFAIVWFYGFFRFDEETAKKFIKLAMIRIFGGVLFAIIYVYYYKVVGDTFQYWQGGMILGDLFYSDPAAYFALLNSPAGEISAQYIHHVEYIHYSNTNEEWFMTKIVSIFGLIGFKSFLVYNVFFGAIGFLGAWQLIRFVKEFLPEINKEAYYVLAYIPGVLIWSSGLIKDTITFTCFSFFLLYFCRVVFNHQRK